MVYSFNCQIFRIIRYDFILYKNRFFKWKLFWKNKIEWKKWNCNIKIFYCKKCINDKYNDKYNEKINNKDSNIIL